MFFVRHIVLEMLKEVKVPVSQVHYCDVVPEITVIFENTVAIVYYVVT